MKWFRALVDQWGKRQPSLLDGLTLEAAGLVPQRGTPTQRRWLTRQGDMVVLTRDVWTRNDPDLRSVEETRKIIRKDFDRLGLGVIEIDVIQVDGRPALRSIAKTAQKPTGFTYIGVINIPFAGHAFCVTTGCPERGMTGMRESAVSLKLRTEGRLSLEGAEGRELKCEGEESPVKIVIVQANSIEGWLHDPYDPSIKTPMTRNVSEDEEYDAWFPDHPLSRLRTFHKSLEGAIRLSDDIKALPL